MSLGTTTRRHTGGFVPSIVTFSWCAVLPMSPPESRSYLYYDTPSPRRLSASCWGSCSEGSSYVLHQEHEVEVVGRARLELGYEMLVELAGFSRLGVHE